MKSEKYAPKCSQFLTANRCVPQVNLERVVILPKKNSTEQAFLPVVFVEYAVEMKQANNNPRTIHEFITFLQHTDSSKMLSFFITR